MSAGRSGSEQDGPAGAGPGDSRPSPALGFSYEGRPPGLLRELVDHIDLVEVVPDCLVGPRGQVEVDALDELTRHAAHLPLVYHGIGLSIGSCCGWNEEYLELLDQIIGFRRPLWHSEHLGFSVVDGHFLGTMGAVPATAEAVELVAGRARQLRERYGLGLLLEHVATPLARPDQMGLGRFLNEVAKAGGCGILLDLHNLECDADNGLLVVDEVLDELDLSLVEEIHVAGGIWRSGLHLDVHTTTPARSTVDLLAALVPDCPNLQAIVFELLAEAVPHVGVAAIISQLDELRAICVRGHDGPAGLPTSTEQRLAS